MCGGRAPPLTIQGSIPRKVGVPKDVDVGAESRHASLQGIRPRHGGELGEEQEPFFGEELLCVFGVECEWFDAQGYSRHGHGWRVRGDQGPR